MHNHCFSNWILFCMIQHRKDFWQLLELFDLKGEVVEVGVAEGNNSELMATWDCVTKMWMVDNWATIEGQKGDGSEIQSWHDSNYIKCAAICERDIKCKMIQGMSTIVAEQFENDSLIMVYLDADHSFDAVKRDLVAWYPKVKSGGIIAGHDFLAEEYGVNQSVKEFCSGRFEINLIPEFSPEDASFWFRKI